MSIFDKKTVSNLYWVGPRTIKLEYDNGELSIHNNVVWSTNKDRNIEGVDQTSGMLHLFQNGAGAGMGFFGIWVSESNPLVVDGDPLTTIMDVEEYLKSNDN